MAEREWTKRAKCLSKPLSLFFLGKGQNANEAKAICHTCPVKKDCLNFAILYHEVGIWGETTDAEREGLKDVVYDLLYDRAVSLNKLETRDPKDWLPPVQDFIEYFESFTTE